MVDDPNLPVVEVPLGADLNVYPVGLGDDSRVTIESVVAELDGTAAVFLVGDEGPLVLTWWFLDEPTDATETTWSMGDRPDSAAVDPDSTRTVVWLGGEHSGAVILTSTGSDLNKADLRSIAKEVMLSTLFLSPDGSPPEGWRVALDFRNLVGGARLLADHTSGNRVSLDSYHLSTAVSEPLTFLADMPGALRTESVEVLGQGAVRIEGDDRTSLVFILDHRLISIDLRGSDATLLAKFVDALEVVVSRPVPGNTGEPLVDDPPSQAPASGIGPGLEDHWHAAYAIIECGEVWPIFDNEVDPDGTHTHGDGLVHIHPFNDSASGENATFASFIELQGLTIEDGRTFIELSRGQWDRLECDRQPSETVLIRRSAVDPQVLDVYRAAEIPTAFFRENSEAWGLARVPVGELPEMPDDRLENLSIDIPPQAADD
ncbi:MAG: hypothetical protein P8J50_01730 [Acidimicrobiales bacterium]|nr:hypothetical protein [Acidimicrobiales bacterium]